MSWLKRNWKILACIVVLLVAGSAAGGAWLLAAMRTAEFWESKIVEFEAADRESPPEPGAIVFTGSSSIVMWSTLAEDMAPMRVLNRGFGGSQIAHVNHYVDRIVAPYAPSAVVLYAGDNDLASGSEKTPQVVFEDFRRFVDLVHGAKPGTPIYFLAIKPSLARWDRWPVMAEANRLISEHAARSEALEYVDVATPMLGEDGKPRPELFVLDGLHMNEAGYRLWTGIVRPVLVAAR